MIPSILAVLVVLVALPLLWYVAVRLLSEVRRSPEIGVLRERAFLALVLALVVTVFAAVFLNNGMAEPILDSHATMVLTRAAILALSIPALYWWKLYR